MYTSLTTFWTITIKEGRIPLMKLQNILFIKEQIISLINFKYYNPMKNSLIHPKTFQVLMARANGIM